MSPGGVRVLAWTDLRLIGRDRFLLGVVTFILAAAVIVRVVVPRLSAALLSGQGFDLTPYYPLIGSYVAIFVGAQIGGVVFGFTLLEAREEGTLRAVLVTPLSTRTYLLYRIGAPIVLGWFVIPAMALIAGIAVPPTDVLIPISFVGAITGATWALFVATFSDNKVQAFALMKIVGGIGPVMIGAYFLPEPWQFLAGVFPPFWALKAYWVAAAGGSTWWVHVLIGAVVSLAALGYMVRRFITVMHR